jgi:hypothetical protein
MANTKRPHGAARGIDRLSRSPSPAGDEDLESLSDSLHLVLADTLCPDTQSPTPTPSSPTSRKPKPP